MWSYLSCLEYQLSLVYIFVSLEDSKKTTKEFLMADQNMQAIPVAFSLMASIMSAIALLGIPAEVYMYGTQYSISIVGIILGGIIAHYAFLPIFYETNITTAYEYLEKRFGQTCRSIAALLFTIQMIIYMGIAVYAPALALNAVTGLSIWLSVVSIAIVCTFYCCMGGLKAVIWSDLFQSILMYFTIFAIIIKGIMNLDVGDKDFNLAKGREVLIFFNFSVDLSTRYTFWNSLLYGIHISMGTFGTSQLQIQRLLSVGNLEKAQRALLWSLILITLFQIFVIMDGVVLYAKYHDCDPMLINKMKSPDQMIPYAIMQMFSGIPGLSGLCIAGVFSASLSTLSSVMNSLTIVTIEDFIRPHCLCKCLSDTWLTISAKFIAIGYGGLCILLTFIISNFRGVLEASQMICGLIGGPVLGVYILGIFSTVANEKGTIFGLVTGFSINAWLVIGSFLNKAKIPHLPQSTSGCLAQNSFFNNTRNFVHDHLFNNTEKYQTETTDTLVVEKQMLYVYRISYLWCPMLGTITVIIVGYLASFIISFCIKTRDVKPEYFSPWVRKYYFKNKTLSGSVSEPSTFSEVDIDTKSCKKN